MLPKPGWPSEMEEDFLLLGISLPVQVGNSKAIPGCCFLLSYLFLLKACYRCQAMFSQINDRLSASDGFCTTKCPALANL